MKSGSLISTAIVFILTLTMYTTQAMDTDFILTKVTGPDESCTIKKYTQPTSTLLGEIEIVSTHGRGQYLVYQKDTTIELESHFSHRAIPPAFLEDITRKGYLEQFLKKPEPSPATSQKENLDRNTHLQKNIPTAKASLLQELLRKIKKR